MDIADSRQFTKVNDEVFRCGADGLSWDETVSETDASPDHYIMWARGRMKFFDATEKRGADMTEEKTLLEDEIRILSAL